MAWRPSGSVWGILAGGMAKAPTRPTIDTVTASVERPAGVGAAPRVPVLTVVDSPDPEARGRRVAIGDGVVIGRKPGAGVTLAIRDPAISRAHARLVAEADGAVTLEDLGSHNGTRVGGARGARFRLAPPALARVGDTVIEITVERGHEAAVDDDDDDEGALLGRTPAMRRLRAELREVGPSRLPALLLGETGTGKEVVARRLHEESGRAGAFVPVNVAAIPATLFEAHLFGHEKGAFTGADRRSPGAFEAADGGTLFLDEVAELPLDLQPKLLRALETFEVARVGSPEPRRVDVRVVAATNADLEAEVRAGTFRDDLYARLAGAVIRLPPLRARRADVPRLARAFFARLDPPREPRWTPGFVEALVSHAWPRNVRELRMLVERLALSPPDTTLESSHLAPHLPPPEPADPALDAPGREDLERALSMHRGNVTRVARAYGKHAKQVYRWLAQQGIDPKAYRGGADPP